MNKKFISCMTAAVMLQGLLCGCEKITPEGANYSFDYALTGNPVSLDPQYASDINSLQVIENMFTGLMMTDRDGSLEKAVADDYTISADGLKYVFKLKSGCKWFFDADMDQEIDEGEVESVTAYDFEFAFKRIFNPETRSPHREKYRCLKNAQAIIKGSCDYNEIGVTALNDTDLIFELEYPSAGFLESLALSPSMPCSERFFRDSKGRYGLDEKSIASNGAFFVRQWFYDPYGHDNFIYMDRNSSNDKFDRIYPSHLNFYIKDSVEETVKAFDEGTSDLLTSFELDKEKYKDNSFEGFFNYTFGIMINPDDGQYSNTYIRKALAYGIDKETLDTQLPDDMKAAYGIIPPGVNLLNKGYREINSDKAAALSEGGLIQYDPEKALSFYHKGMEQMGLQSLKSIKLMVPVNFMNTEYLHLVTQSWQSLLGFYIGIEEVTPEDFYSRIAEGDYTLAMYPLSGDYNDPIAFLEQFKDKNNSFGYSNSSLGVIIDEIEKMGSFTDAVDLYSRGENIILNDFQFIPVFYKKEYSILGSGNHDIMYEPFTKQVNFRYAKYYE